MSASVRKSADALKVHLQADLLAFLEHQPKGLELTSGRTPPPWEGVTTAGRAPDAPWADDIVALHGAATLTKTFTQKRTALHFWDQRLLRHAYLIGSMVNGDPLVQVTGGRFHGQVLRINHENFYGFIDEIARLGHTGRRDDEFIEEAMPVLRRLGYKDGEPTTDQVIGLLLRPDFDAAECIAKSFTDFYRALYRARQAAPAASAAPTAGAAPAASSASPTITVVELPSSGSRIVGDANQAFITWLGAPLLDGSLLMRVTPGADVAVVRELDGIIAAAVRESQLYLGDRKGLRLTTDGRTFKTLVKGWVDQLAVDHRGGVWLVMDEVLRYSSDGVRFDTANGKEPPPKLLAASTSHGLLGAQYDKLLSIVPKQPPNALGTPRPGHQIFAALETHTSTLLNISMGVMRSTDGGKRWSTVKLPAAVQPNVLFQASSGAIVAAGMGIAVSLDDGQSFKVLPIKLKRGICDATELGPEVLLLSERQLYRFPTPR